MKYGISLGYTSKLNLKETVEAISVTKNLLKESLKKNFNLIEVGSSIVTEKNIWLNDDSQQTRRPIDFDAPSNFEYGELLQTNNKWRRYFLYKAEMSENDQGIFTDFTTVARDAKINNVTSLTFEEFGMEIVKSEYDVEVIKDIIVKIFETVTRVDYKVSKMFDVLEDKHFGETLTFITYKKLRDLYPLLTFKERLTKFGKDNGAFVLQNFVEKMFNQNDVEQFSSDVFDFETYSKIYYYNKSCEKVMGLGYVSFQVDREMLKRQNNILKETQKSQTQYNHLVKSNELPLTISAGIFINRMLIGTLEKQHIAEVHSSIWDQEFIDYCETNKIKIL
ncbi:aspartate--ammonia ligase [Spiroplasma chinense]|uniref:Aspartate--ammonia ligase n=1 Tax=Spiroplasma chinense TaxID=216932 RepID=A0A5B9Y3H2_9MOLU|nr:hypothetical protein [Spiroplasma chinense]QEH61219.1 aspartate--ammonia ligase [Spiroplasma chinense]